MNKLCVVFGGPERLLAKRVYAFLYQHALGDYDVLFVGTDEEEEYFEKKLRFFGFNQPFEFVYSWNTWTNILFSKDIWEKYDELFIASEKYHLRRIKIFFARLGRVSGIQAQVLPTKEKWNAFLLCLVYSTRLGTWIASQISRLFFKRVW